jgi:hypothetical protein
MDPELSKVISFLYILEPLIIQPPIEPALEVIVPDKCKLLET